MNIHHIALYVKSIEESIDFYVSKLGFEIINPKGITEDKKYSYINIDLNGIELELIQNHDKNDEILFKENALCPHIAFESKDINKDIELLKKNNIDITDGPHTIPNDVIKLTILDPNGYKIDIGQLL